MPDSANVPPPAAVSDPSAQQQGRQRDSITPKSASPTKAAGPKSSESSTKHASSSASSSKAKQTKSRNGCITCKLKRLKCDEKKPGCDNCAKRSVTCGGYKKDFKWRPFEEQQHASQVVKQTPSVPQSRSCSDIPSHPQQTSPDGSTRTSSLNHGPPKPTGIGTLQRNSKSFPLTNSSSIGPYDDTNNPPEIPLAPTSSLDSSARSLDDRQDDHFGDGPFVIREDRFSSSPHAASFFSPPQPGHSPQEYAASGAQQAFFNDIRREFTVEDFDEMYGPAPPSFSGPQKVSQYYRSGGDLPDHIPQRTTSNPSSNALLRQQQQQRNGQQGDHDDDVEEVLRLPAEFYNTQNALQNQGTFYPFQDPGSMLWVSQFASMVQEPQFASNSVEMLVSRFDRRTCGIMSIKDGPSENPWRTLFLPLMHSNQMMFNAVMAMACLHSSKQEPRLLDQGKSHFETAFKELQLVGAKGVPANLDMALAAMLALAFGESWGWSTSSGINYIRLSRNLMYGAIQEWQSAPRDRDHLKRLKFLCRTWIYIDVIARLTSVDDDDSCDFEAILALISSPGEATIDPLMGCASTLFPVVGRVATLIRRVCKVATNQPDLIAEASSLKMELEAWQAPYVDEIPEDRSINVAHSLQTAEAYRWATLLYLHQAVPELPSHSSAELARQALKCLAAVPLTSRTVIVQIYPLMAAGTEAYTVQDRNWVRNRWRSMIHRMAIGNVDRCADVVKEVWRRRDEYEKNQPGPSAQLPLPSRMPNLGSDELSSWSKGFSLDTQSATFDIPQPSKMPQDQPAQRGLIDFDPVTRQLLPEFTVRGHLHWAGVMKDWNWEVLLG